jgi:hypothetical protein
MPVKLRVGVQVNSSIDIIEVLKKLSEPYDIGYLGVYVQDGKTNIYVQGGTCRTRMAPNKIRKLTLEFVEKISKVEAFKDREGTCVQEIGQYREEGRPSKTHTCDTEIKIKIKIKINPFREEDLTHITADKIEKMIGQPKEKIEMVERNLNENTKQYICDREWDRQQSRQRRLLGRWKLTQICLGIERDGEQEGQHSREVTRVLEKRRKRKHDDDEYDDSISELSGYNSSESDYDSDMSEPVCEDKIPDKILFRQNLMLLEHAEAYEFDYMIDLFNLVLSNPRNANVKGSVKEGFKFFSGGEWVKKTKLEYVEIISENIISISSKILKKTKRFYNEGKVSKFTYKYMKRIVTKIVSDERRSEIEKCSKYVRRCYLKKIQISIENLGEKIKKVERRTGKKVKIDNDGLIYTDWNNIC